MSGRFEHIVTREYGRVTRVVYAEDGLVWEIIDCRRPRVLYICANQKEAVALVERERLEVGAP